MLGVEKVNSIGLIAGKARIYIRVDVQNKEERSQEKMAWNLG
jgi:hypothetical protein